MKSPAISVIMPVYNGAEHLREAMEGILSQSFRDFEFIVINDCSTDKTGEILKFYTDDKIRVITNKERLNQAASRNIAIKNAGGEYCAFADADDVSLPDRLLKQISFMKINPRVSALGTAYYDIKKDGNFIRLVRKFTDDRQIKRYLSLKLDEICLAQPTMMCRKDSLLSVGLYNESLTSSEDLDLLVRMASQEHAFANLNAPLVKKRRVRQDCQEYADRKKLYGETREQVYLIHAPILDRLYQRYRNLPIPSCEKSLNKVEQRACAELYFKIGQGLYMRSQMAPARKALFAAIRCFPFQAESSVSYAAYSLWIETMGWMQKSVFKRTYEFLRTAYAKENFLRRLEDRSKQGKISSRTGVIFCLLKTVWRRKSIKNA